MSGGARADAVTAEALFRLGREAMARGDYELACTKFGESLAQERATGTLMNLADCEEHRGALATAWQKWNEAADTAAAASDQREAIARGRAGALVARVPRLTIHVEARKEPSARVARDGADLGPGALDTPLPVDPGKHRIEVRAEGHAVASQDVALAEGETREITMQLGAPVARGAEPRRDGASGAPPAAPDTRRGLRTAGYVVGTIGLAGIAAGAVTSAILVHDRSVVDSDCTGSTCGPAGLDAARAGKALLVPNVIAWIVGGLGVGGGAALLWLGRPQTRTGLVPSVTAAGATFRVEWAY